MARGISIDFDWDDTDIQADLEATVRAWPSHRRAVLKALGEDVAGGMRDEIPTSSGTAKSTIRVTDLGGSGDAHVMAGGMKGVDYIEPLLEGSRPHGPGKSNPEQNQSLARWARRNNYPGGFESIYWAIFHYGTKAHDFVSEPVAETQARADTIGERVLRHRGVFE